ncbi:heparinase II/III domain-containing protein [Microbacterium amylolyticum]|uniref:Heparinase II/III-like C-terminal domain-containing protein n=1 Tax=Microbacterium amylolyticum TaxID=936337 RepID=A0ABS4ZH91_9MICO|nr:heparinase II/III family protein [Microbacterium amylolyticum]MBP2436373.1 hypothetical protein [Microbacterium amylolyticum]
MTCTSAETAPAFPLTSALAAQIGAPRDTLAAALAEVLAPAASALPLAPASQWAANTVDGPTIASLRSAAAAESGTPWPQPLAHDAARFHGDGDRITWETAAFARQDRLTRAAVLAAAGDEEMLADVVDGVILLCEQSSWCWPAHDDAYARNGLVLPDAASPYLDLGAGEVVAQLAWLDQALGDALESHYPGVRERIRYEARIRIFRPFLTRRDWHWTGTPGAAHNWNPWIHGNVIVGALRLLDGDEEREQRARVITLALEGMDAYVATLPVDGAIDEGYGYWWNGACRLLEALDVLVHASDGVLDAIAGVERLRETIAFPHRMHLGGEWFVSVADAQAKQIGAAPWHALHRAARHARMDDAAAFAASRHRPGTPVAAERDGLGRLLRAVTDVSWREARHEASPLPASTWLESTQMLVAREHAGSARGLSLVVKGGHNGENHNHNDVGSVIVASDGVPVIVDPGRPTYDARTFGPGRYELWPMQSEWHSVPFIDGSGQSVGRDRGASRVAHETSADRDQLSLDISGAYDAPTLRSWVRTAALDRVDSRVTITDEWERAADADRPTQVRFLLAGDVALEEGSAMITPLGDAPPIRLDWDPTAAARLTPRPLDDPMMTEVWGQSLTRLDIDVTDRTSFAVTARQTVQGIPQ